MLQNRRVFDIINRILNYLFMVFLLLGCMYFVSFWIELRADYLTFMVNFTNLFAWIISGASILMFILALVLVFVNRDFPIGTVLWCLLRMVLCIGITVVIDVVDILEKGGVSLSL